MHLPGTALGCQGQVAGTGALGETGEAGGVGKVEMEDLGDLEDLGEVVAGKEGLLGMYCSLNQAPTGKYRNQSWC